MDAKNIIQQGERAKYFVRSDKLNFNFEENSYHLEIIYGMMGQKITIPKSEFQYLNEHWVFSFPTDKMVGPVVARLHMDIHDPDCPNSIRQEIDDQVIAFIVTVPFPNLLKCPIIEGSKEIIYERTEQSDIAERYARLCDRNHNPLKTSNGEYMFVLRNRN
jgi:hypothetical protein